MPIHGLDEALRRDLTVDELQEEVVRQMLVVAAHQNPSIRLCWLAYVVGHFAKGVLSRSGQHRDPRHPHQAVAAEW